MDTHELLDASAALRWTLWIWNTFCALAAVVCLVAAIALGIDSTGDDIGSAVSSTLAGLAFLAIFVVGVIWLLVRAVVLIAARAFHRRQARPRRWHRLFASLWWTLLVALGAATFASPAGSAQSVTWRVIAQGHTTPADNRYAVAFTNVNNPKRLAVRVLVRRGGRFVPGRVFAMVECPSGAHRYITRFQAQTPFLREPRFRPGAHRCSVGASAYAARESTAPDVVVQILARWR